MMDKYEIRHRTLGILADKAYHEMYDTPETKELMSVRVDLLEIEVSVLIEKLNVTEYDFRKSNHSISHEKEATYLLDRNGNEAMIIESAGILAFENRKYLKERFQEKNERIYSITKWVMPALSLVIAGIALWVSLSSSRKQTISIYLQQKDTIKGEILKIDSAK